MHLDLIKGPPGTGKTTTISAEARAEVEQAGKHKVIVASLTRAAAREAARVVALPDKQIGTWHSFAYRALNMPQLAEAHLNDWNEHHPALQLNDSKGARKGDTPDFAPEGWGRADKLMLEYGKMRATQTPRPWHGGLMTFVDQWEDWKQSCGYVDFHDLIEMAQDVEKAPGDPEVIFCDEAQDLSMAEARLIAHWGKHVRRLVLVGDNHQALFGWRGSDPVMVQALWDAYPADTRVDRVLAASYRVPRSVLMVANAQMRRCAPLPLVRYSPRDADGAVCRAGSFNAGDALVRDAAAYIKEGKSVMFIATCGYMLEPIIRALSAAGLPWHNPWRVTNGRWNPLQVSRGVGFRERCCAFTRPRQDVWGEKARFWNLADVKAWVQPLPAKSIFHTGMKTKIGKLKDGMANVELAQAFQSWFTPEALPHILNADLDWYLRSIPDTEKKTSFKLVKSIAAKQGAEALLHEPKAIVGTVHSLKGAEADVVYMCPDVSGAAARAGAMDAALRQEIQRVFYVAVTRAREVLVLCHPGSNLHVGF